MPNLILDAGVIFQTSPTVRSELADETMYAPSAANIIYPPNDDYKILGERNFSPNESHSYHSISETEAPSRHFPIVWPESASDTMQGSPTASLSTTITYSPSDKRDVMKEPDFSPNTSHSYDSIFETNSPSEQPPSIWSKIAERMVRASSATNVSTEITHPFNQAKEVCHGRDFSSNEIQQSFTRPSQSSCSPAGMIMSGQAADMVNGLTRGSHEANSHVMLNAQEHALGDRRLQAQNSHVLTSAGATGLTPDLSSDRVAPVPSSSFIFRHGRNFHEPPTPIKIPANRSKRPLGELYPEVPKHGTTLSPSPHPSASPAICETCGKSYNAGRHSSTNLKRHQREKHLHPSCWKHICKALDCKKGFPRADWLKTHYNKLHKSNEQANHKIPCK